MMNMMTEKEKEKLGSRRTDLPITIESNLRILRDSIKLKAEHQSLSFSASEVAMITGYHPYTNIVEIFTKYLYQSVELLYELDLTVLEIKEISVNEELTRIISKCSTEKQEELRHLTSTLIEQQENLQNHKQVKEILQKTSDLLSTEKTVLTKEEYEFIQEEMQYRIKTNYGKFNEEKALNLYESITGFPVVERNEACYVLEVPFPSPVLTTPEDCCEEVMPLPTDPNTSINSPTLQESTPSIQSTAISIDVDQVASNVVHKPILEVIDLCDSSREDISLPHPPVDSTKSENTPPDYSHSEKLDQSTSLLERVLDDSGTSTSLLSSTSNLRKAKISDFFIGKKRISSTSETFQSERTTNYNVVASTSSTTNTINMKIQEGASLIRTTTTIPSNLPRSHNNHSNNHERKATSLKKQKKCIAFSIIGKIDGASYQIDATSEDYNDWKQYKIIIEMKNRVQRIRSPPPLYEQIQLTAYLIMTNCMYGDLVQVIPEEEKKEKEVDTENDIQSKEKETSETNHLQPQPSNPFNRVESRSVSSQSISVSHSMEMSRNSSISNYNNSSSNTNTITNATASTTGSSSITNLNYQSSTFSITRISLDGPPYYHRYHWDTVIIPRLHIFTDAIKTLRRDDDLRYSFLLASEKERLLMIYYLCPYFEP